MSLDWTAHRGGAMHLLDFDHKDVRIAVDGVARRSLIRRLETGELGATLAWVNITLLAPDGATRKLFYSVLGRVPKDEKPTEPTQDGTTTSKINHTAYQLMRLNRSVDGRFCGLPTFGRLDDEGTYCLPHSGHVLLVVCVGFPAWETNHTLSSIIALQLRLELCRLTRQSSLSA